MNTREFLVVGAAGLLGGALVLAQAVKSDGAGKPNAPSTQINPDSAKSAPKELESKFTATLTKATLTGRWCAVMNGQLGPEKEDKYTILGVSKLGGELWLINARIEYGTNSFVAPIPVQVKWAGDTPVIVVDKVGIPGAATYSARVMIYEKTYAGTWNGGDHGGLLSGVITNERGGRSLDSGK